MKNFTKQNFKTNPLWIRLLIMGFMLLLGTSSAWAAASLMGTDFPNGNWDGGISLPCTLYLESKTYNFKVKENTTWYEDQNEDTMNPGDSWQFYSYGKGNTKLKITTAGYYTLSWNESTNIFSVVEAIATAYVVGGYYGGDKNYSTGKKLTKQSDGTYSGTFSDFSGSCYFQIYDDLGRVWGCDYVKKNVGESVTLNTSKNNKVEYSLTSGISYIFSFNPSDGTFSVKNSCSDPTSVSISRGNPTTGNICQSSTIDLTANVDGGSGDITYAWTQTSGGNDWTIANAFAQKCTVTAGTGSATFKITATRCGTSKTNTITLTADTKPSLTLKSNPTICQGDRITLSEYESSSSGTVKWYSNSGRTTEIQNLEVTPSPATTTYYARATNGVCSAVDKSLTVTVRATPTKFDVTVGNADNKVKLSNSQSNYTYTLYNEKGEKVGNSITGSTGTALQWIVSVAGTYTVKAKYKDSTCDETEMNGSYTYSPCTPANVQITSGPSNICPGGSTSFTYTAAAGANITWKMKSASSAFTLTESNGTVTVRHSTPSTIVNGANNILYTVTDANNICPASDVDTEKTITLLSVPSIAASTSTTQNICYGTKATLTVTSGQGTYTWVSSNGGEAIALKTNSVTVSKAGTYTVTAQNAGGCTSNKITFTVTVKDQVAAPSLNSKSATVCGGDAFKLPNIDGVTWSLDGKPTTGSQPGIANNTDAAIIKTFQAVKEVDGCPSAPADYIVTVNPTPVITGESVAQPGKANAINLKLQDNLVADWSVDPTADFSYTTNINSTAFSAETNGTYTITATTKDGCSDTHVVTVADAFYVYMRQPKKGETAYNNFYYPTQNPTQGGDLFYKEYSSIPPAEGYTDYNQGGRAHDVILTDCDGYVWYGFKASAQLIDGTNYFTVHAPNKNGYDGRFTHTDITKPGKMTGDIYYIMGTEGNGNSGWKIEEASAPYSGPVVHALGSTTLGADKFAALYVTDCSGKEIDAYQWEYCRTQDGTYQPYSSVCSYTFEKKDVVKTENSDAGQTNNIRPSEIGYYRCKVTYKDGNTATSATEHILGSYSRSFTSNIPVLVVNTGGKGFPDCTDISGQTASLNASKFKAKRSVDVKIYDGETLVYDRKARMNYRGSSSLNFVKKSYAFCPGDANCGDKDKGEDYVKTAKLNMLGVGKACDKDWVLYAAAADPSLMRNRLVFDSYKAMTGKWGVNSRYVELIVDGVYKGVYVFMDKITMNTERVKVDEDKGFIVKFDKTDKEDRVGGLNGVLGDEKTFKTSHTGKDDIKTYDTYIDQRFEIEYPEKDDYKTGWKARVDGIQGMFQAFEDALKQGDYATVQKYIDYTSWADWFIINEFTKNVDAYRASCIFVYTGEAGAKIEARPLWDQELSFNNQASNGTNDKGCDSTTGLLIQHSNVYSDAFKAPFWFTGGSSDIEGGLLSDPCFVQVVKERWNIHQFGALSKKSLEDLVDKYEDDLAPEGTTDNAQTRETAFWKGKSRGTCDCSYDTENTTATGYQNKTFAESTGTITNWISDAAASNATGRRAGLTTAINGLTGASFSIQIIPSVAYTTPWEPVEIAVSVTPAGYDYKLEYTGVNNLGGVANTIIKEEGDKIIYRIPRPDDWETGDELFEGERTDIEYGIKATLSVQEGTTVCGSQAAPTSTAKIILQDEPNDECPQP